MLQMLMLIYFLLFWFSNEMEKCYHYIICFFVGHRNLSCTREGSYVRVKVMILYSRSASWKRYLRLLNRYGQLKSYFLNIKLTWSRFYLTKYTFFAIHKNEICFYLENHFFVTNFFDLYVLFNNYSCLTLLFYY